MPLLTLPHLGQVYSAAFSGDGKRIVTAAQDGIARIWNAETGNLMRDLIGHSELLYGASFDHNGKRVVTASADKTARIWDTQTASLLFTLPHDDAVKLARYNSPADKIVTESGGTIRMWDAATGTLLWSQPEEDTVIDARFSLDGERVVTGSASGLVSVRDAKTGQLIKIIHPAQRESVQRISLSPDATRFFTATQDLSVEAFDTETGKRTALLSLTYGGGIPVLFGSTDGGVRAASQNRAHSLVAAALWDDGTARVWDTTSGALLAILSRHEGPATSVEFSPEGGYVVTAGLDNTARVWRLDPIIFMPAKQRREYLCRTRLLGIERLTPKERANPVIQGQSSRWNGCERHGWFSLAFYAHALNAILAKVGIELPLPNKPTLAHPLGDKKRNLLMSIEDLAWHLPSLYLLRDSARVE
jgi:WD40 repeat protein